MEEDIIALLSQGDERGIELAAKRYGALIRYVIKGILGNRENDIEECVNDTYLKFWKNYDSYDSAKALIKNYLVVIARNTALTKLRTIMNEEKHIDGGELSDCAKEYVQHGMNPEEKAIEKENLELVYSLVNNLKAEERELIQRRYFYMQSSKYIADKMNMTVSAVDNKISRIKKKLKVRYDERCSGKDGGIKTWTIMFL